LQFNEPEIRFVHAITPTTAYDTGNVSIAAINGSDFVELEEVDATEHLAEAVSLAKEKGFPCSQRVQFGNATTVIEDEALVFEADLIALAANPHNFVSRCFAGSTTLSLAANSERSLLIVRDSPRAPKKVSIVYATDHSVYGNACLDRLIGWDLKGIEKVNVLNAYELAGHESAIAGKRSEVSEEEVGTLIRRRIESLTESVAQRFKEEGIGAWTSVINLPVREAISNAMQHGLADLLVMGAVGHSNFGRMLLGSTTLHEVAVEPFSTLIIRASVASPKGSNVKEDLLSQSLA
jgi:nucleotide-binding universal stress UspA family protein